MFFIVNKTKQSIVIGDLGLKLGPRQATDLDKRFDRGKSEKSSHLKKLVQTGVIEIKRKDGIEKSIPSQPKIDKEEIKKDILAELKDHVKDGIKEGMAGFKPGLSEGDLAQAIEKLALIISQNQGKISTVEQMQKVISDEKIDVDLDENTLGKIHAMAMDKMTKNIEIGKVDYKKEKTKNDIDDNVNELESLLGD